MAGSPQQSRGLFSISYLDKRLKKYPFLNPGNVGNVAQVVVLVTGGCGYVGTHTVLQLLEQNVQVVVVDNLVGVTRGKTQLKLMVFIARDFHFSLTPYTK